MRLIIILAVVGGLIAFIGDKLGSKIGKKKLSVFGLRPYYTSVLMTVITGVLIAATTIIVMAYRTLTEKLRLLMPKKHISRMRLTAAAKSLGVPVRK